MKNENQTQNRKKTYVFTLSLACSLLIIGIMATSTYALQSPSVTVDSATADPGEANVCVDVHVNSGSSALMAVNLKITYPTTLDLTSFSSSKLLGSSALEVGLPDTSADTGMIDYAQALPFGATTQAINGVMATLCFTVPMTEDSYLVDLVEVTLLDASGNPVTGFTPGDGTITVMGGSADLAAQCPGSKTGTVGTGVQFTGGATGGTLPYSYYWQFGDGGTSTSQNPTHTYSSTGTYTAILQVTDAASDTDSCTTPVTITETSTITPPYVQICPTDDVSGCPANVDILVNESFCINIMVNSGTSPVMAVNLKFTYPGDFDLTSFSSSKLLGSSALEVGLPDTSADTGMIDYAQALPFGATTQAINGNLATLCFDASDILGIHYLTLTEVILLDQNGDPISDVTLVDATRTIIDVQCVPDVNADGRVNVLDMILVGQHWGQTATSPDWMPEADTNNDGMINVLDMICIGQNWTG